jgi:3-deoxy-D-arabino-heptulosonate 7-phosphate (DAHP) synthase class II
MAGQFAKPRTSNWETTPDGQRVASYKGDSINGFDISERKPDPDRCVRAVLASPETHPILTLCRVCRVCRVCACRVIRLVQAYFHSVATANYLRAMVRLPAFHLRSKWGLER